jgi:NADPH2:quinone reductase
MKAIEVSRHGGPEVLRLVDVPEPAPGLGQVLVANDAAGVNYIDTYHRRGAYPRETPFILGLEGAGTITAVGPDVTDLNVGERVAWSDVPGSYAEQVVVPAARAVPVPDEVPSELATASLLQGMTAHYLTRSVHEVTAGESVLVHAAAGGTGRLITQIATRFGGRVIATVSTEAKAELAREAGAAEVIRYAELSNEELAAEVRRLTDGEGVAAVYDGVGAATFEASLASLRRRGMLALFGASSGPVPPFDLARLNAAGSLFVTRPTLGHYVATREELLARAGDVFAWIADGTLSPRIGARYPLHDAATAHTDLESRATTGKLLLLPALS